jgi:hypothetical protein
LSKLKIFFVVFLSHFLASAVFVLLVSVYDRLNGEKEAWPIIGIAILLALAIEILMLLKLFQHQFNMTRLTKLLLLVIASWIAGLISFLMLGNWAELLHIKPPIFSWLFSSGVLFMLSLVSAQSQT